MTNIFDWKYDTPIHEAVGNAIGAASMCWNPTPEGIFDDARASQIADELMEFIQGKMINQ